MGEHVDVTDILKRINDVSKDMAEIDDKSLDYKIMSRYRANLIKSCYGLYVERETK